MRTREACRRALESAGYELIRIRKHMVWRHPSTRQTIVLPMTPSDPRTLANLKAEIRRKGRRG